MIGNIIMISMLALVYFACAEKPEKKGECNCSTMVCANKTTIENLCKAGNATVEKGECGCCDICVASGAALDSPCGKIMDGATVVAKRKCKEGLMCDRKSNTCVAGSETTTGKPTTAKSA